MVKAELAYNPYLLETTVRFNGNPPRINSLVEKYRGETLQSWIDEIPMYFHDEMNGYDFDLVFSGTDLDFEELEKTFRRAGVSEGSVRLSRGKELGNRNEKVEEINGFLEWLDENPNRRFDWSGFKDEHRELFENAYPLVAIGPFQVKDHIFDDIDTAVDRVDSVAELKKTDLHNTPILFCLDRRSVLALQHNLSELLNRQDVAKNQLFFLIDRELGDKTERVIKDLGVSEPQIVQSESDDKIRRYLEVFPMTEFVHSAISVLDMQSNMIAEVLEDEAKRSEMENEDVHARIRELDEALDRLREARDVFTSQRLPDYPVELSMAKARFIAEIGSWRKRKTKISGDEEAKLLADEYASLVSQRFGQFRQEVFQVYFNECAQILTNCGEWYRVARHDDGFTPEGATVSPTLEHFAPNLSPALLSIKRLEQSRPKEDFFESMGKLFSNSPDDSPQEPRMETVYYCEEWREHAESAMTPIADDVIREAHASQCRYLEQLRDGYIEHIDMQTRLVSEERERVSAQLSEEERLLQADFDWHLTLREKLYAIERS